MNQKTYYFTEIDSTNSEAIRRAKKGSPEGEIFIAEHQTAGRGRMGRSWESPKGKNLYISFLLRPKLTPEEATYLTLMAGMVVHQTLFPLLPKNLSSSLKIKQPNDIYLGDKKLCGILSEMSSEGSTVLWAVVGIGLNINSEIHDFSKELQETAASLKIITGKDWDRGKITTSLVENFEKAYAQFCQNGFQNILDFCCKHNYIKT